jgi:hypothetical protein
MRYWYHWASPKAEVQKTAVDKFKSRLEDIKIF